VTGESWLEDDATRVTRLLPRLHEEEQNQGRRGATVSYRGHAGRDRVGADYRTVHVYSR
jgi:hypothetical protein